MELRHAIMQRFFRFVGQGYGYFVRTVLGNFPRIRRKKRSKEAVLAKCRCSAIWPMLRLEEWSSHIASVASIWLMYSTTVRPVVCFTMRER